jgi:hypothetical protein
MRYAITYEFETVEEVKKAIERLVDAGIDQRIWLHEWPPGDSPNELESLIEWARGKGAAIDVKNPAEAK